MTARYAVFRECALVTGHDYVDGACARCGLPERPAVGEVQTFARAIGRPLKATPPGCCGYVNSDRLLNGVFNERCGGCPVRKARAERAAR